MSVSQSQLGLKKKREKSVHICLRIYFILSPRRPVYRPTKTSSIHFLAVACGQHWLIDIQYQSNAFSPEST